MKKQVKLNEAQLRKIVAESVRRVLKEMIDEPIQVTENMFITDIEFLGNGKGTVNLSIYGGMDGDAFQTEFEIDESLLDAMMNNKYVGDRVPKGDSELSRCVTLYRGVQYSPEASTALKMAIVNYYLENNIGM